jgi:hypothetical protein
VPAARAAASWHRVLLVVSILGVASIAWAAGWSVFKSDRFGFAMLLAPGMTWEARDFGSGWGGIAARKNEVAFLAIVKLGYAAPPRELGDAAIALTRVPAAGWRKVDEGKGQAGWKWWQTYEARNSATGRVLFTVLGTGPRGSYILCIETSEADFKASNALYQKWYRSLTLY